MKNLIIPTALLVLLSFSCGQEKGSEQGVVAESAAVDPESVYLVKELMDHPEGNVDRMVSVKGTVTHVCRHSGQRLHLETLDGGERIRVEAGDKIVRFERELEGSEIVARGILRKEVINRESIQGMGGSQGQGDHDAEDHGEESSERAANYEKMLDSSGEKEVIVYWLDGESFEEI